MANIRLDNKCNYNYSEIDNVIEKIHAVREDVICSFEASRDNMLAKLNEDLKKAAEAICSFKASRDNMQGGMPSDFMRDKLRSLKRQKNMALLDVVLARLSHVRLLMEYNAKLSSEAFFSAMVGSDALRWSHDIILNDLCAGIDVVTDFITYGDVSSLHKTVLYDVVDILNRVKDEYACY